MLTFRLIIYGITTLLTLAFLLAIVLKRTGPIKTGIAVVIAVAPILMFHHYRFLIFSPLPQELQLMSVLIEAVLFMVLFLVIGKYRDFRTVFMVATIISLMSGGKTMAAIIYIYGVQSLVSIIFLIVVDLLVFIIMIKGVDPMAKALMKESDRGWASLSLIPTFFYLTTYLIAYYPDTIYEKPVSLFVILALFATQLATYTQFFTYMKVRVDRIHEQKALIAARSYNEGLEVQREQVEKTKNELRTLRHDIRSEAETLYSSP